LFEIESQEDIAGHREGSFRDAVLVENGHLCWLLLGTGEAVGGDALIVACGRIAAQRVEGDRFDVAGGFSRWVGSDGEADGHIAVGEVSDDTEVATILDLGVGR
jgi:hypothetical protein